MRLSNGRTKGDPLVHALAVTAAARFVPKRTRRHRQAANRYHKGQSIPIQYIQDTSVLVIQILEVPGPPIPPSLLLLILGQTIQKSFGPTDICSRHSYPVTPKSAPGVPTTNCQIRLNGQYERIHNLSINHNWVIIERRPTLQVRTTWREINLLEVISF